MDSLVRVCEAWAALNPKNLRAWIAFSSLVSQRSYVLSQRRAFASSIGAIFSLLQIQSRFCDRTLNG